ncbi:hypothetical protein EV384_3537 [Micromonospora kangleipakensis]|uniref:Uncharacterized protein n=1 Tax=Micromonospora kangleipakensis TaxID=1077942 RepID=A0A4Q8BB44_9ACTN|nr:hypothetical protein [Micromonospora kangleipakensis]RZU75022.1 hypothetical protein EV384_3537 [Micromonospora kangleipakensis]
MRYLTRSFALGALGRRKEVEQFIGPITVAGIPGVRWVSVWPWQQGYNVPVHDVQELDDEHYRDLDTFPPLDPEGEDDTSSGRLIGHVEDAAEALELAERATGASPHRWANHGVAGEDYADFVLTRRGQQQP